MNFDELTEEQKARARAAQSPEEILELAREEGYELSEGELEAVSGGWCGSDCSNHCAHDCRIPFGR
ncbi:MAG: Nif11-like leader peptide family natural product precursor [Atopobiaceae bacterium]|nr:Nif11-like leader peptide family natural product precursor [Atopobiaceae bacterium]